MKTKKNTLSGYFVTSDTILATFLWTLGHETQATPLRRKTEDVNGENAKAYWGFRLTPSKFTKSIDDSVSIWKQSDDYIKNNTEDESYATISTVLGTLSNLKRLKDVASKDRGNTIIDYKYNGKTFHVLKGSERHKKILNDE